jgi:rRNA maturation endonuclease Nob1
MSFVKIAKPVSVSMQDRSETLNVLSPIQDTSTVVASDISSASVPNQNNTVSEIEELAHKENILLSPEALRLIQSKVQETEEGSTQYLAEVIEKAKAEYPREDGWILLSKERAEALMGGTSNNTPIAVENNEAVSDVEVKSDNGAASEKPFRVEQKPLSRTNTTHPSKATAPTGNLSASRNTPSQNLVSAFMGYLLHVQKKEAFDLMRNITTRGVDVATFITLVVRQLDEVYKNRIEGNRSPDQELVTKTDSWTNEDFEAVLGILVECIDYSYSNNRIGTKIALAKVFEHFENKK